AEMVARVTARDYTGLFIWDFEELLSVAETNAPPRTPGRPHVIPKRPLQPTPTQAVAPTLSRSLSAIQIATNWPGGGGGAGGEGEKEPSLRRAPSVLPSVSGKTGAAPLTVPTSASFFLTCCRID